MTPQMRRLTDFLDEASIDLEARDLYKETAEMTQWAETASVLVPFENFIYLKSH